MTRGTPARTTTILNQPGETEVLIGSAPGDGSGASAEVWPLARSGDTVRLALVSTSNEDGRGSETSSLLRERLRATAWALALIHALILPWSLLISDGSHWFVSWSLVLRLALSVGVAVLLGSAWRASVARLRFVEILFFGGLTLLLATAEYFGSLAYIGQQDIAKVIGFEKNGILQMVVLMMLYGVLIPNDPRRTARAVVTMALGPLIVLSVLLDRPLEVVGGLSNWDTIVIASSNALYLTVGAGLAIYASHLLRGLRRELRDARRLGQYRLVKKLGFGGMGEVYLAEHQLLKRPCALKRIRNDVEVDERVLARFEREVQSAAVLTHPNTISIYDYGRTEDGTFYYVMEYLTGMASSELVNRFGPMPVGRAVYLMRQICGALAEAHRLGLIHRDLKPANIFVAILGGQCDVAKVLDFGLVKLTGPGATDLTSEHAISGTPLYMSPEQALGDRDFDHRVDVYALGGILYNWLTGQPPFVGRTATAVMIAHARDPVVPPSQLRPEIPSDLEGVILKCLAKSADGRYNDTRALEHALGSCACAADWDAGRAEAWWAAQAIAVTRASAPASAAAADV